MEALAGGGSTPLSGIDGPQEPTVFPRGQKVKPSASQMGSIFYPVSNVRFLTAQAQEMSRPMPCPGCTLLRRTRGNQKGYCQLRSLPAPSSGPHHQSPLPLHQPIRRAVHPITNMFLGLNALLSSIPLTLP